jgi:hypothetical protein
MMAVTATIQAAVSSWCKCATLFHQQPSPPPSPPLALYYRLNYKNSLELHGRGWRHCKQERGLFYGP